MVEGGLGHFGKKLPTIHLFDVKPKDLIELDFLKCLKKPQFCILEINVNIEFLKIIQSNHDILNVDVLLHVI